MKDKQKNIAPPPLLHLLLCIGFAIIMLLLMQISFTLEIDRNTAFFAILGVYLLFSVIMIALSRRRNKHRFECRTESISSDSPMTIYDNITMPVAVCNDNGSIIWANRIFQKITDLSSSKVKTVRAIMGFGLEKKSEKPEDDLTWEHNDSIYRVFFLPASNNQTVIFCEDISEAEKIKRVLEKEETYLAYIVIDNLDELLQIEQENTTSLASTIAHTLMEWGAGFNGVIKEYERNKFIFIMNHAAYENIYADKFSILDKIRWIPVGKSDIPATISIGLSTISGTLAEKDADAKAALELALARGGDQAVIKSADGVEFVGGMTKSSQKRSTVKSRNIADKLTHLIYESSNVIIMGHRFADFDALGACLGIARMSMQCGKPCYIIADRANPDLNKCYDHLRALHSYDNVFINASEAAELNYSDSLLVVVDVNNPQQLEDREIARLVRKVVYIDHHRMTGEFERPPVLHYVEPSASSTCEMISEILEQTTAGSRLSKQEANIMYAGIMLDTKRFVINTGVRTFSAAQYLRGQGANPAEAQEFFKTGVEDLIRQARFETNVEIYRKYYAISVNTDTNGSQADRTAAAKVADDLLTVDGVLASFALCRIGDTVRISARSTGKINVQRILEALGGGGHYDSAATQMSCSLDEAVDALKGAIDGYFDN